MRYETRCDPMAFSTSFTNLRETAGDSAIVRIEKQEKFERSQIVSPGLGCDGDVELQWPCFPIVS